MRKFEIIYLQRLLYIFSIIIFMTRCADLEEQKFGNIEGYVIDTSTRNPIQGADITILNTSLVTQSDSLGYYFIPGVEIGDQFLVALKQEYDPDSIQISITEEDTLSIDIKLLFNSPFWSSPLEDSFILFFLESNLIRVDSTIAGKTQFRLDVARTVDVQLDTIHTFPSWEFGKLLLGVSDDLYDSFNLDNLRFNYPPLDSLLELHDVKSGRKTFGFSGSQVLALVFPNHYNMPILAKEFKDIPGIWAASSNGSGGYSRRTTIWSLDGD